MAGVTAVFRLAVSQPPPVFVEAATVSPPIDGVEVMLTVCAAGAAPPTKDENETEDADSDIAGEAACVIVKFCPAAVSAADRAAAVRLRAMLIFSVAEPVPEAPLGNTIIDGSLADADQLQPACVAIEAVRDSPA